MWESEVSIAYRGPISTFPFELVVQCRNPRETPELVIVTISMPKCWTGTVVLWGQVCFRLPISKFGCWGPPRRSVTVLVTSDWHFPLHLITRLELTVGNSELSYAPISLFFSLVSYPHNNTTPPLNWTYKIQKNEYLF